MDSLNCAICYERYTENGVRDPRVCPCGHTFCLSCLELLIVQNCPVCRKNLLLAGTNPSSLPRNLSIVAMLSVTIPNNPMTESTTNCFSIEGITGMTASQLRELQETVHIRLKEERAKELLASIDSVIKEKNEVNESITMSENQIDGLKQLIIEEEKALEQFRNRKEELELKHVELLEKANYENIAVTEAQNIVVTTPTISPLPSTNLQEENNIDNHNLSISGDSIRSISNSTYERERRRSERSMHLHHHHGLNRSQEGWRARTSQIVPEPIDLLRDNSDAQSQNDAIRIVDSSNNSSNNNNSSSMTISSPNITINDNLQVNAISQPQAMEFPPVPPRANVTRRPAEAEDVNSSTSSRSSSTSGGNTATRQQLLDRVHSSPSSDNSAWRSRNFNGNTSSSSSSSSHGTNTNTTNQIITEDDRHVIPVTNWRSGRHISPFSGPLGRVVRGWDSRRGNAIWDDFSISQSVNASNPNVNSVHMTAAAVDMNHSTNGRVQSGIITSYGSDTTT